MNEHSCPMATLPIAVQTRPFGPSVHISFAPHPHCGTVSLHGTSLHPVLVLVVLELVLVLVLTPVLVLVLDDDAAELALFVPPAPPALATLSPPEPSVGRPDPCAHAPPTTSIAPTPSLRRRDVVIRRIEQSVRPATRVFKRPA